MEQSQIPPFSKEEQEEAYKYNAQIKVFTLAQIMQIVNIASMRGAFKADELSFVGGIFDTISKGVSQSLLKARESLAEKDNIQIQSQHSQPQLQPHLQTHQSDQ